MKILSPSDMLLTVWGLNTFRAVGSPPYVRNFVFNGSLLGFPSPSSGFWQGKRAESVAWTQHSLQEETLQRSGQKRVEVKWDGQEFWGRKLLKERLGKIFRVIRSHQHHPIHVFKGPIQTPLEHFHFQWPLPWATHSKAWPLWKGKITFNFWSEPLGEYLLTCYLLNKDQTPTGAHNIHPHCFALLPAMEQLLPD